jgi:transcriptional regulator with XRE-family HTH domain
VKNMKKLRLKRGLTQADIADIVGVKAPTVCLWETRSVTPSVAHLIALADAFKVSVDFLLDRKTPAAPADLLPRLKAVSSADVHACPMVG